MTTIIESKMVTTRKEHQCFGCRRIYPAGTEMEHSVQVDDYLFHIYLCHDCLNYLDTLDSWERAEGFCEGDLLENEDYPNREQILNEIFKR